LTAPRATGSDSIRRQTELALADDGCRGIAGPPKARCHSASNAAQGLLQSDLRTATCPRQRRLLTANVKRAAAPCLGPEVPDQPALCTLHHKLFDLGALGLDTTMRVRVSSAFTARTTAGQAVYQLDGRVLSPRPGTCVPAAGHVSWHRRQVFKGLPLRGEPPPAASPPPPPPQARRDQPTAEPEADPGRRQRADCRRQQ